MTSRLSEQTKKANISNIIKKVKAGKVISEKEIAAIEEFENQQEQQTKPNSDNRILLSSVQCALFFDITTMTLTNWARLGFPREAKNTYDLKKCFTWWQENINAGASKKEDDARERYWSAKAESEEIKIARIKSELLKKESIFEEFAQRASDLKTSLRALKYRLSGLLANKEQDEVMQILGKEIDEMLRNYCREGKYITTSEKVKKSAVSAKKTKANKKTQKRGKK